MRSSPIDRADLLADLEPQLGIEPRLSGQLTFGGADKTKYCGKLATLQRDPNAPQYWIMDQTLIRYNGTLMGAGFGSTPTPFSAQLDTGADGILLPFNGQPDRLCVPCADSPSLQRLFQRCAQRDIPRGP